MPTCFIPRLSTGSRVAKHAVGTRKGCQPSCFLLPPLIDVVVVTAIVVGALEVVVVEIGCSSDGGTCSNMKFPYPVDILLPF